MLPLEWVYMFDPCCKMGQLDMRVPEEGSRKSQSGAKAMGDASVQQGCHSQVR